MEYNFKKLEKKWQAQWEKEKVFQVREDKKKKKYYVLEQFPYPSGTGLHIGHSFVYTIGDIYARFKKMSGFNVLHPMGYDSFGLPAENAANKTAIDPKKYTEKAIEYFSRQQKALGLGYDWSRVLSTHKPEFYRWDQWIFLKMFEKGLVYKKISPVNWCPKCDSVLANEQVVGGNCWIHSSTQVQIKHLEQWYFKITKYAGELNDFSRLKEWPELIKKLQINWIGRSEGAEVLFEINGDKWPVFTTRIDTIFGVTFVVVSAQHPRLMGLVTEKQKKEVEAFVRKLSSVKEEDINQLDKEGVFTGSYAINPMTKEKVPVYAGNFVIADYGSGMVMGVPAHDKRDFGFAAEYNIPVKVVIKPKDFEIYERNGQLPEAYEGDGELINSEQFNGMQNKKAQERIIKHLEEKKLGKKTVNFKLRDWLVSRQRYWGTPIPIVYCKKCGIVPVPEKDLPVLLPEKVKFGKGNPLETAEKWINVKCPKCKGKGRRETDTMDTFVNSSWYFLRYCDNKNSKKIFDTEKVSYWCPIDVYVGGREHACMHDIYMRFYTKFLRDLGLLKIDEPAAKLFVQGIVHAEDGNKMSKSLGNVVDPMDIINAYGADSLRMFLVSVASPESDFNWDSKGVESTSRFLKKVFEYFTNPKFGSSSKRIESKVNSGIREITKDVENFRYNLAIIKTRKLFEAIENEKSVSKKDAESFLKMLSVFAPHISEELWERIGNKGFVSLAKWPEADESKIDENLEKEEKAVDKIAEDINNILKIVGAKKKVLIYAIPNEKELYANSADLIKKKTNLDVSVFAVNDKSKYDPENKAGKSKPGKPALYLE
ncbi:MAG: leucine--tRNA ligase [Candidatus Nanoarchaeia archaeon]|nr:leucine--tRNA ligase [Candidatus Nanoarchaeia archaeon]